MNNDFWVTRDAICHAMIFTRDFATRENHWQISSFVTQNSLFTVTHALLYIFSIVYRHIPLNYCELGSVGCRYQIQVDKLHCTENRPMSEQAVQQTVKLPIIWDAITSLCAFGKFLLSCMYMPHDTPQTFMFQNVRIKFHTSNRYSV